MLGIGTGELMLILLVALIVLGPDHLPKVMRTVGKGLAEFRKVSTEVQRTINTEVAFEEENEKKKTAAKKKAADNAATTSAEEANTQTTSSDKHDDTTEATAKDVA